jgi:pimeloyl-ACP methyl ester carboxylesterase
MKIPLYATFVICSIVCTTIHLKAQSTMRFSKEELTDAALVKKLPGFTNEYADVNGMRIHYVEGGKGKPLVLLPGWPETWWSYRRMMPLLAASYHVIAVDIRGMGGSEKPAAGYDKKTMAQDVYELVKRLGYKKVFMAGHDIGSMVAFSFAANHPDATEKLVMLDIPHPDDSWYKITMIPGPGKITEKIDEDHAFQWWFAFHQVDHLPEELMLGRVHYEHDWIFHYLLYDEKAVDDFDRAVYVNAYDSKDGIRAGNAWYKAFTQDIEDAGTYAPLTMPVLGIAGPAYNRLNAFLATRAPHLRMEKAEGSGHFIPEEKPQQTADSMIAFLEAKIDDVAGAKDSSTVDYLHAPNKYLGVGPVQYAYRILGKNGTVPLVLLQHYRGTMDNWDPAFINALAGQRTVITFDNQGVGLSAGETPDNFTAMGDDAANFIAALGCKQVDVLGFSIGGCVAQELTANHPQRVRRLILAATAPRGGQGMNHRDPKIIKIVSDPTIDDEGYLTIFFDSSVNSRALGNAFLERLRRRTANFDKESSMQTAKAHAAARQDWGKPGDTTYAYLKKITQPVLIANGSHDIMMFSVNSYTLFQYLPNAHLIMYPDSGHAFLFQYPEEFSEQVNQFLNAIN